MLSVYKGRLASVRGNQVPMLETCRDERNPTNRRNHAIFQRINVGGLPDPVKISTMKALMKARKQDLYPEFLDRAETTELRFRMSPYDLLTNIIGSRRAKQALKLGRIGWPPRPNDTVDIVSDPRARSVPNLSHYRPENWFTPPPAGCSGHAPTDERHLSSWDKNRIPHPDRDSPNLGALRDNRIFHRA